jgi:hypothetical protein
VLRLPTENIWKRLASSGAVIDLSVEGKLTLVLGSSFTFKSAEKRANLIGLRDLKLSGLGLH